MIRKDVTISAKVFLTNSLILIKLVNLTTVFYFSFVIKIDFKEIHFKETKVPHY